MAARSRPPLPAAGLLAGEQRHQQRHDGVMAGDVAGLSAATAHGRDGVVVVTAAPHRAAAREHFHGFPHLGSGFPDGGGKTFRTPLRKEVAMHNAVIVDAIRTPLGKRNGKLKDWHPVDLVAEVMAAMVERNGIEHEDIVSVIFTATEDLVSEFPAKAARGIGLGDVLEYYWQTPADLAHYARACVDILFKFPFSKRDEKGELKGEELEGIAARRPDRLVISPGPCSPAEAGISVAAIQHFAGKLPILGVCLGHQSIGYAFGGNIIHAKSIMHGKTSLVYHHDQGVFKGLNNPFTATRYHSLVIEQSSLPECLEVTAWTQDEAGQLDEIMGVRHKTLDIEGVQFHPESVLTEHGHQMLGNWLVICGDLEARKRSEGLTPVVIKG